MKSSSKLCSKSLWTSIVTMLLIISAMVPLVAEVAEAEINTTGTYFWVSPTTNIVYSQSQTFSVDVMIEGADETWAWEATLNFDNNTLGVISVTKGTWLSEDGAKDSYFFTTPWDDANKTGTISFGCTLQGDVSGTSGSGVLCTITFHVESSGISKLDLQDTALLDMDLVSTEYPNNDGFFTSGLVYDLCITEIKVNDTQVEQGQWVEINVTIWNEGDYLMVFDVDVYADLVTHNPADADDVAVGDELSVGTQTGINLAAGGNTTVTFTWITTTVAGEKWTISAEVSATEDQDTHDNVFIGPVVHVICPHDIKVTDVKVLTPFVHVCTHASVNVTVVNEGQNIESFNVEVYADGTKVATAGVVDLAVNESRTVTATWHVDTPGVYVISAKVPPVADEKDTDDNVKVDGKVKAVIDDIAVLNVTINPPCGYEITVTIKNNGTDWGRFTVWVWADPTPEDFDETQLPPSPDALCVGWIPLGALAAGTNYTFLGLDPYGGIPFGELPETLFPPYTPLSGGTSYGIFAVVEKEVDVDDNPNNNAFFAGMVKARIPGDIDASAKVDWRDLSALGRAYGSTPGAPNWNMCADFDASGKVDWRDLSTLGRHYGESC